MNRAILDTDILSEFLKGRNADVERRAKAYLDKYGRFTSSVVTLFEIVRGRHKASQPEKAAEFLSWARGADVLPIDFRCAARAGELAGAMDRAGTTLPPPDVLIAATAMVHGLVVVTGNTNDFSRFIPLGLEIDNWRSVGGAPTA